MYAKTALARLTVSKLGVRGWNIAYIGGEDSAYPSQDCRVLRLRWEGYAEGLPNSVMGRLGVSSSQGIYNIRLYDINRYIGYRYGHT